MENKPERITALASAIMDMAERDKGIVRSNLEELIFQHCAAADAKGYGKCPVETTDDLLAAFQKAKLEAMEHAIYPPRWINSDGEDLGAIKMMTAKDQHCAAADAINHEPFVPEAANACLFSDDEVKERWNYVVSNMRNLQRQSDP